MKKATDQTWFNDKNGIGSHESAIVRRLNKGIGLWLQGPRLLDMIVMMRMVRIRLMLLVTMMVVMMVTKKPCLWRW